MIILAHGVVHTMRTTLATYRQSAMQGKKKGGEAGSFSDCPSLLERSRVKTPTLRGLVSIGKGQRQAQFH